jgi:hypothetical protein
MAIGSDFEGWVVWLALTFPKVDHLGSLLYPILLVFLPDILGLLAYSKAKRPTPNKVREPVGEEISGRVAECTRPKS